MSNTFLDGGPARRELMPVRTADALLADIHLDLGEEAIDLATATGRVLVHPAAADRPVPSFDRVCMDGYALSSRAFAAGRRTFAVRGAVRAGEPRRFLDDPEACLEVMTGSVLPAGCDAVVAVERTVREGEMVRLEVDDLPVGANVHPTGRDRKAGDPVVPAPVVVGPGEIAALASLGVVRPVVRRRARIAVVSSGDELVDPSQVPAPHQLRQSNVWGLAAALERAGCARPHLHHLDDDRENVRQFLSERLPALDLLVLSGGVSMGRWDLLPSLLREAGVRELFHGLAQQPGMPLWMGIAPGGALVAGLPGNPVAALACLARHVRPTLDRAEGRPSPVRTLPLAEAVRRAAAKTRLVPVRRDDGPEGERLHPMPFDGSGDWAALVGSHGVAEIPPGTDSVKVGGRVDFYPW